MVYCSVFPMYFGSLWRHSMNLKLLKNKAVVMIMSSSLYRFLNSGIIFYKCYFMKAHQMNKWCVEPP